MNDWYIPPDSTNYLPQSDTFTNAPQNLHHLPPFPIAPLGTYRDRETYERDMRYLMSLYPDFLRPMLDLIKETVDQYDRPGSFLYDAYPDKEQLLFLVYEIYDRMVELVGETIFFPQMPESSTDVPNDQTIPAENPAILFTTDPRNLWLISLIQILLSNEILYRRRVNHDRHRYWYGF